MSGEHPNGEHPTGENTTGKHPTGGHFQDSPPGGQDPAGRDGPTEGASDGAAGSFSGDDEGADGHFSGDDGGANTYSDRPGRYFEKSSFPEVTDRSGRTSDTRIPRSGSEVSGRKKKRPSGKKKGRDGKRGSGGGKRKGKGRNKKKKGPGIYPKLDGALFVLFMILTSVLVFSYLEGRAQEDDGTSGGDTRHLAHEALVALLQSTVDHTSYTDPGGTEYVYFGRTGSSLVAEEVRIRESGGEVDPDSLATGIEFELYRVLLNLLGEDVLFELMASLDGRSVFRLGNLDDPGDGDADSSVDLPFGGNSVLTVTLTIRGVAD